MNGLQINQYNERESITKYLPTFPGKGTSDHFMSYDLYEILNLTAKHNSMSKESRGD